MALFYRDSPFEIPTDPEYYQINAQKKLLAISGTLTGVALLVVAGRIYVRARLIKAFKIDDWLMVAACIFDIVCLVTFILSTHFGEGKRLFAIHKDDFKPMLRYLWVFGIFAAMVLNVAKVSIAFHLLRLTQGIRYKHFLIGMLGVLIFLTMAAITTISLQCRPIAAAWDYSLRPPPLGKGTAQCIPFLIYNSVNIANSGAVLITDIILALLPVPLVWNLQVATRIKISLIVILGLGFFACLAGAIKLYHQLNLFSADDAYGHQLGFYIWQIVEMNVAVIAASLPAIKPLLKFVLKNLRIIKSSRSGQSKRWNPMSRRPLRRPSTTGITMDTLQSQLPTPGVTVEDEQMKAPPSYSPTDNADKGPLRVYIPHPSEFVGSNVAHVEPTTSDMSKM